MNWDEIRGMLREAHEEPLEEARLAAVRARVLERVQKKKRVWWPVWAGAAAGIFAVTLWIEWGQAFRPAAGLPAGVARYVTPNGAGQKPDGDPEGPAPPQPGHERKRVVRRERPVLPSPKLAEPLLVKLITDDPNVVIYWIAAAKGD